MSEAQQDAGPLATAAAHINALHSALQEHLDAARAEGERLLAEARERARQVNEEGYAEREAAIVKNQQTLTQIGEQVSAGREELAAIAADLAAKQAEQANAQG